MKRTRAIAGAGAALAYCALVAGLALGDVTTGTFAFMVPVGGLIAVGTLIVVRRHGNLVGWLCWLAGLLGTLAFASGTYTDHALSSASVTLDVAVIGWLSLWLGEAWVMLLLLIPLVFPDGLPSPRWRPLAGLAVAVGVSPSIIAALDPAVDEWDALRYNPVGIHGAEQLFSNLERALAVGVALLLVAGVSAQVVRFRRGTSVERLQLRWLLYAIALVAPLFTFDLIAPDAMSQRTSDVVFGLAYGTVPIAIGVAVLRYRLYDIDHLIRRTIVYAMLTAILGLVYAGGVLVAGSAVSGERSDLAVAASTLAAAALFRPLRHRIQLAVDRRFNRRRFDATRTVAAFSDTVREELDADALARELLGVARRVVEPARIWLWRPADRSRHLARGR